MTHDIPKMSDCLKEMACRLFRDANGSHSSESMQVALMFANFAWNETVGLDHPRSSYRPAWESIEQDNPDIWNEFKSKDVDDMIDELVQFKKHHYPDDRRRILTCGIPDGKIRVEWVPPAVPGIDTKAEMQLYGLVRTGRRVEAIRHVQQSFQAPQKEAEQIVARIAADLGMR